MLDRYRSGWVIALAALGGAEAVASDPRRQRIEAAVIDLIRDDTPSPVVERAEAA